MDDATENGKENHVALLCKDMSTLGESVVDFTTWMYHDTKGSNIHLLINPLIHLIQHSVKLWRSLRARIRSSAAVVVFWLAMHRWLKTYWLWVYIISACGIVFDCVMKVQ